MKPILLSVVCGFVSSSLAQPSFTGLGFLPGQHPSTASAVSADGSLVGGVSGNVMFLWTSAGGMQNLGTVTGALAPTVTALSGDGSTLVGYFQLPVGYRGFNWTASGGFSTLDPLDGDLNGAYSVANDVSADGSVVVGASRAVGSSAERAVRWTAGGGKEDLFSGHLLGVSADGDTAAGISSVAGFSDAVRWTESGGPVNLTPELPVTTGSTATDVSADGSTMVGRISRDMYLFFANGTRKLLASTSAPNTGFYPYGISDDGRTVVGQYSAGAPVQSEYALVWCSSLGTVNLNTYLPTIGVNLAGWTLDRANSVSADGTVIVGKGTHNGEAEAWVARIPSGCLADVGIQGGFAGHDGQLNNNDFVAFIIMFFNQDARADRGVQGGLPGADGQWNNNDFIVFIDQFFRGC